MWCRVGKYRYAPFPAAQPAKSAIHADGPAHAAGYRSAPARRPLHQPGGHFASPERRPKVSSGKRSSRGPAAGLRRELASWPLASAAVRRQYGHTRSDAWQQRRPAVNCRAQHADRGRTGLYEAARGSLRVGHSRKSDVSKKEMGIKIKTLCEPGGSSSSPWPVVCGLGPSRGPGSSLMCLSGLSATGCRGSTDVERRQPVESQLGQPAR